MAQVDTSIYGNLLRPPKSVAEYSAEMDQAEQNRLGLQQSRMNLLGAQQAQQDQQAMRALYQQPDFNPQTDEGIKQLMRISPQAGAAAMKARQDAMKAEADIGHVNAQTAKEKVLTEKEQLQTAIAKQSQLGQVARAAKNQADWDIGLQIAQSLGIDVSQVPKVFSPDTARVVADQVMTGAQQLEQVWKQKGYDLDVAKAGEQVRHNKASEGLTARGQNMTDARQRDANEISKSLTNEKKQMEIDTLKRQKEGAISAAGNQIAVIDKALNHPGLETSVGLSGKIDPRNYIPGTDAADFKTVLDQIGGSAFLQAFESLKGGGQITEVEGKKATDAIARLNRAQSDKEFKQSLNDLRQVMTAGYKRLTGNEYQGQSGGKKVVRTGTLNGRKVVQYDDGKTDYAD